MKNLYIGCAFLFLALASCSTSDSNSNNNSSTFLPLTSNSSWEYDVNVDAQNLGRDHLFVNGEITIDDKIYQKISAEDTPNGFYTNMLNKNNIRKEGDKLRITGTAGLTFSADLPLAITISDFIIFKENSNSNTELDAVSGSIEQELQGIPLKIDYTLKSVFKESLTTFIVPGKQSYTNIKVIKLIVNLKVTALFLLPVVNTVVPVSVLNSQDVIVSTNYYAEGIGMIYSKTEINYSLNNFSQAGIDLPIPQQGSSTIEEFLD